MALISLDVNDVVTTVYKQISVYSHDYTINYVMSNNTYKDEDTYLLVFGPMNKETLKFFRENNKFNILHESITACNKNYRNSGPRNTLFIFEKGIENVS